MSLRKELKGRKSRPSASEMLSTEFMVYKDFLVWLLEEGKERCYNCLEFVKMNTDCKLCGSQIKEENYNHLKEYLKN